MSGPIVRSGPTPEYSKNWDNIFGKKKSAKGGKKTAKAAKTRAKTAKKKSR